MAYILGQANYHDINNLTPEDVKSYSGLNLELFENIRVEESRIVGDLKPEIFDQLPGRYGLWEWKTDSGFGKFEVVDLHYEFLHGTIKEKTRIVNRNEVPGRIIKYSNDKWALKREAHELNLPKNVQNCPKRRDFCLVPRPIKKTGPGPYNWRYADEELVCPECGAEFVSVFSKYFSHP